MILLREVLATGVPFVANEVAVAIVRNEALETIYVDLTYQPRYDTTGGISGILVVATDVTAQVLSRQRVEESEARFRSLIEEAPVSTCLFVGPELIIGVINEVMLGYWGRDRSVIGKPLAEALPELKGQPHLQILNEVYRTGRTYEARQVRADLMVEGVLKTFYFDLIHKPLFNAEGQVYAIMDMSTDVTAQVLSRQRVEENEARFRSLIEEAPVALPACGPGLTH